MNVSHDAVCAIGVDWGTSRLRIYGLDEDYRKLFTIESDQGFHSVRGGNFAQILFEHLPNELKEKSLPIIVSGMAGARGGWVEMPYVSAPIGLDGLAHALKKLDLAHLGPLCHHQVFFICGVCDQNSAGDVMRGEEVQVFGAATILGLSNFNAIMPGTHSKSVRFRDGKLMGFETYMTGELYALLCAHSTLRPQTPDNNPDFDHNGFEKGVVCAQSMPLEKSLFSVRARVLLGSLEANQAKSYLSGLLIGSELRSIIEDQKAQKALDYPYFLIGDGPLCDLYDKAFEHLNLQSPVIVNASTATIAGYKALMAQK